LTTADHVPNALLGNGLSQRIAQHPGGLCLTADMLNRSLK
jgi:hypothetical protein